MMKILVISDKESEILTDFYSENNFEDISFVLSAGDLSYSYLQTIKSNLNKPLYYVQGNHDIHKPKFFDKKYIEWKVKEFCGIRILGIGCRKRNGQIMTEVEMTRKLNKLYKRIKSKERIDIVIAHYPARCVGDGQDKAHTGFLAIKEFVEKIKPIYFIYGHNHLNYGKGERIIRMNDIIFLNAYEKFVIEFEK